MEGTILGILETASIAFIGALVKKYVFLEPDLEPKRQRLFYAVTALLTIGVFFAFGKDWAAIAVLALLGLNICLARERSRPLGLLLMLPFLGIINGLLMPVMLVPPYIFSMSDRRTSVYQFIIYAILTAILILFYFKGRDWRLWFQENMSHRSLRRSEQCLLWVVGILMIFFSNVWRTVVEGTASCAAGGYGPEFKIFIGVSSLAAFIMTITIITLIFQGNKRAFYHEQISTMHAGVIASLAEVVENRDDNTGGHVRRTAVYVEGIARTLKKQGVYSDILTDQYIQDMIVAAPLHDLGKIHIPDSVLNKPGRLTDEEYDIMKTHAAAGEDLLTHIEEEVGESEYLDMAVEMAAFHHEWWDGTGYPYGISGEDIPLCARIMAVADVFDALTSKRVYKEAMTVEEAYSIIRKESGTHFDPAVVDAFFVAIGDMEDPLEPRERIP